MPPTTGILLATSQYLFGFWPLVLLVPLEAVIRGRSLSRRVVRRALNNLLIPWSFLAVLRAVLFFSGQEAGIYLIPEPLGSGLFFAIGLGIAGVLGFQFLSERKRVHERLANAQSISDLMDLSPLEFESLVAEIYRSFGHRVERAGSDRNADVELVIHTPNREKWIVQCKRWQHPIDERVVRELLGQMHHRNAHRGTLITTSVFTPQAKSWAEGKPLYLYDGEGFFKILNRARETKRTFRGSRPVIKGGRLQTTLAIALAPSAPPHPGGKHNTLPLCPNCGAQMSLRQEGSGDFDEEPIYICQNSPECQVMLSIH